MQMDIMTKEVKPPHSVLLALEFTRPTLEFMFSLAMWPFLRDGPKGDRHPVLVFPGLAAAGASTIFLRHFLKARGYTPHCWQQGINLGPRPGVVDACRERILQLRRRHGRRVSLLGWSLGGVYARELAKTQPDDVRMVITLGSPFGGHENASNAQRFYRAFNRRSRIASQVLDNLKHPPPVPTTSIYSRSDGIVHWRNSLQYEQPHTENIEVLGSHIGLGYHPAVLYAIADRLSQPEGGWKPFDRSGLRQCVFAPPAQA